MNFNSDDMPSFKPYVLRAFHAWCIDNNQTPLIIVDVTKNTDELKVPMEYAANGHIAFNLAPEAVRDLELENDYIAFDATFNGIGEHVHIPFSNVKLIIADEIKQGIPMESFIPSSPAEEKKATGRKKPIFTEVT